MSKKPHSADVLNDIRDYWWSPDFISLMAKRWQLPEVKSMLDVGCGIGHWGQMLMPHLANDATIDGIDPENSWVKDATERAQKKGFESRSTYKIGSAESIPYPDNHFDMVTCQTVLIHVKDVSVALKEMLRVLKPGGLLAVAEPNNLVSQVVFNNAYYNASIDDITDLVRFNLICERGREALGRGNAFRGDILPYIFHQAGIMNIQVYMSDLADYFIPPYDTPREKITLEGIHNDSPEAWDELQAEYKAFYLAGGGAPQEFSRFWNITTERKDQVISGYLDKTLCSAGGLVMYLISGQK